VISDRDVYFALNLLSTAAAVLFPLPANDPGVAVWLEAVISSRNPNGQLAK
jgi:hypothetical protein